MSYSTYNIDILDNDLNWQLHCYHIPKDKPRLSILEIKLVVAKTGELTEFKTIPEISIRDSLQLSIDFLNLERRALSSRTKNLIIQIKHALSLYYLNEEDFELAVADYLILSTPRFAQVKEYKNDSFTLRCVLNYLKKVPDIKALLGLKRLEVIRKCLLLFSNSPNNLYSSQELQNNLPNLDKSDYRLLQKLGKGSYLCPSELACLVNALCSLKEDILLMKKLRREPCLSFDTLINLQKVRHMPGLSELKLSINSMVELARRINQPTYLRDIGYMLDEIQEAPPQKLTKCETAQCIINLHDWCVDTLQQKRIRESAGSQQTRDFNKQFPTAFIPGTQEFIPLVSHKELINEGDNMHHCIGSVHYAEEALKKRSCFYKILKPERATLELIARNKLIHGEYKLQFSIAQLVGLKNNSVSAETRGVIEQWVTRANKKMT